MIECKYFSRPSAYTKMASAGFANYDNSVLFLPPGYVVLNSVSYVGICHPKGCEFRSCSSEIRKLKERGRNCEAHPHKEFQ